MSQDREAASHGDQGEPEKPPAAGRVEALDAAGRRAVDAGDYAAARSAFERVLALCRDQGDQHGILYALFHVAWVMRFGQGEVAAARPLLEEALAIARTLDDPRSVGSALGNLGDIALDEGDFLAATRLFQESLVLLSSITRDAGTNGATLEGLAMAAAGQEQWVRALRLFGAATALREAEGCPQTQPAVVARFARLLGPARVGLGADASASAEAAGRAMSLDQAIAYALEVVELRPPSAAAGRAGPARRRRRC
jgi:tetratricopeptide (TPR) repeat protein